MRNGFVVLQRGDGEPLSIGQMTQLVGREEWTDGAYCIYDQIMAPRLMSAVHAHASEDQVVFVLEGTVTCWVDGSEQDVRTGGCAVRPSGVPHAMWNATDEPARFLEITSPGERQQQYMFRLSSLIDSGAANAQTVGELAREFGISFYPEATEQLRARLELPVGGFWK